MIPCCYFLSPFHHFPSALLEIKRNPLWDLLIIFFRGPESCDELLSAHWTTLFLPLHSSHLCLPHFSVLSLPFVLASFSSAYVTMSCQRALLFSALRVPVVLASLALTSPTLKLQLLPQAHASEKTQDRDARCPRICVQVVHHAPCHVRHAKAWQLANVLSLAWKGFVNGACCNIRTWPERATRWSRFVRGGGGLGRIAAIVGGTELLCALIRKELHTHCKGCYLCVLFEFDWECFF